MKNAHSAATRIFSTLLVFVLLFGITISNIALARNAGEDDGLSAGILEPGLGETPDGDSGFIQYQKDGDGNVLTDADGNPIPATPEGITPARSLTTGDLTQTNNTEFIPGMVALRSEIDKASAPSGESTKVTVYVKFNSAENLETQGTSVVVTIPKPLIYTPYYEQGFSGVGVEVTNTDDATVLTFTFENNETAWGSERPFPFLVKYPAGVTPDGTTTNITAEFYDGNGKNLSDETAGEAIAPKAVVSYAATAESGWTISKSANPTSKEFEVSTNPYEQAFTYTVKAEKAKNGPNGVEWTTGLTVVDTFIPPAGITVKSTPTANNGGVVTGPDAVTGAYTITWTFSNTAPTANMADRASLQVTVTYVADFEGVTADGNGKRSIEVDNTASGSYTTVSGPKPDFGPATAKVTLGLKKAKTTVVRTTTETISLTKSVDKSTRNSTEKSAGVTFTLKDFKNPYTEKVKDADKNEYYAAETLNNFRLFDYGYDLSFLVPLTVTTGTYSPVPAGRTTYSVWYYTGTTPLTAENIAGSFDGKAEGSGWAVLQSDISFAASSSIPIAADLGKTIKAICFDFGDGIPAGFAPTTANPPTIKYDPQFSALTADTSTPNNSKFVFTRPSNSTAQNKEASSSVTLKADAYPTITNKKSVVNLTRGGSEYFPGDKLQYTLEIKNDAGNIFPIFNPKIVDTITAGSSYLGAFDDVSAKIGTTAANAAAITGTISCVQDPAGTYTFTTAGVTVPVGSTLYITYTVTIINSTITTSVPVTNEYKVYYTTNPDGTGTGSGGSGGGELPGSSTSNGSSTITITKVKPEIGIKKAVNKTTDYAPGEDVTFTITARNKDVTSASPSVDHVVIVDRLPAEIDESTIKNVSYKKGGSTYAGTVTISPPVDGLVKFTFPTDMELARGEEIVITFTATLKDEAGIVFGTALEKTLTNNTAISIGTDAFLFNLDGGTWGAAHINNTDDKNTYGLENNGIRNGCTFKVVKQGVTVGLTKTANPTSFILTDNKTVTYTITVYNRSKAAVLKGGKLIDRLPDGFTFVSIATPGYTLTPSVTGQIISVDLPAALNVGESMVFTVTATIPKNYLGALETAKSEIRNNAAFIPYDADGQPLTAFGIQEGALGGYDTDGGLFGIGVNKYVKAHADVSVSKPIIKPGISKNAILPSNGKLDPGATVEWEITFTNQSADKAMANYTVFDILPAGFSYKADTAKVGGIAKEPAIDCVTVGGEECQLLKWQFSETGDSLISSASKTIKFTSYIPANFYGDAINNSYLIPEAGDVFTGRAYGDLFDDGSGLFGSEYARPGVTASATAGVFGDYQIASEKFVTSEDKTETAGRGDAPLSVMPGETVTYTLELKNNGSYAYKDIVLIDIFPALGDYGVTVNNQTRGSKWALTNPVFLGAYNNENQLIAGAAAEYSGKDNGAGGKLGTDDWTGSGTWSDDPADAKAMRINLGEFILDANKKMTVKFTMYVPATAPAGEIAWNSFGFELHPDKAGNDGLRIRSEPPKVGVKVASGSLEIIKTIKDEPLNNKVFSFQLKGAEDTVIEGIKYTIVTDPTTGIGFEEFIVPGKYILSEIDIPAGYRITGFKLPDETQFTPGNAYEVTVTKGSTITVDALNEADPNSRFGSLEVTKLLSNGAAIPAGVTFTFILEGADGSIYTRQTGADGIARFDNIKVGRYILSEESTSGYSLVSISTGSTDNSVLIEWEKTSHATVTNSINTTGGGGGDDGGITGGTTGETPRTSTDPSQPDEDNVEDNSDPLTQPPTEEVVTNEEDEVTEEPDPLASLPFTGGNSVASILTFMGLGFAGLGALINKKKR